MYTINHMLKDLVLYDVDFTGDEYTWEGAYYLGYREPRFPVPAPVRHISWEFDGGDYNRGILPGLKMHIRSYFPYRYRRM